MAAPWTIAWIGGQSVVALASQGLCTVSHALCCLCCRCLWCMRTLRRARSAVRHGAVRRALRTVLPVHPGAVHPGDVHCVLCSVLPMHPHLHLLALPVLPALCVGGGGGLSRNGGGVACPPCTSSVAEMLPKTSCSP